MKRLGVLYPEKQMLQLSDMMDVLGATQTDTARVALYLGLQQLKELSSRDVESAQELLAITAHKVKQ